MELTALAITSLWDFALGGWPLRLGLLVLWAVLMTAAVRQPGARWGDALPWALASGVVVAMGFEFAASWLATALPLGTAGMVGDIGLRTLAGLFGMGAAALAWPLLAMHGARSPQVDTATA